MMPSASSWNGFNMVDYAAVIYPGFLNAVGTRPAGCPAAVPKTESGKAGERGGGGARKYAWAQLMMRVLGAVGKILSWLGLPTRAPPIAPATRRAGGCRSTRWYQAADLFAYL